MPHKKVNGIQIYFEDQGTGDPLVLLNGLAFPMDLWFLQIRELSRHFRVIAPDNRGIGRTDKPDEEYSIALMASDTAGLLRELGIEKANIAGLSMGGFIAQEIALAYPEMVNRLILIATGLGGKRQHELSRPFWEQCMAELKGLTPPEMYRKDMILMTAPGFDERRPDLLERSVAIRLERTQPLFAFLRQYTAAGKFDSNDRVHRVTQPTLIIFGDKDRLFPIALKDDFVKKIPNARSIVYENCGHAVLLEKAEELNRDILNFLTEKP